MDQQTIQRLCELNNGFYREHHQSFSETRQGAWSGWERVISHVHGIPESVLDVACGNVRFKSFLESRGIKPACYYAVDSCPELLPLVQDIRFQELDVIGSLLGGALLSAFEAPACDVTVCFGFMHHVPTNELRKKLIDVLLEKTAKNGLIAISFWQFAYDEKMLEKACATTERGCAELGLDLEEGDYLLGWNEREGAYRYCHSFADSELDEFASHCKNHAALDDRFKADGRTGEMNGYLVFRKLV